MRKWWVIWPLFAGLMGFALGASFFFGLYGRDVTESGITSQQEQNPTRNTASRKKEETDEALASYTLWLMAFTGVLAFATIGLGIATIFLYTTGEKQFRFAVRSGIRQSNSTKKSIEIAERALTELERPYLFILDYNWLLQKEAELIGEEIGLGYTVANGGKLPAFIRAVKFGMRFGDSIPRMEDEPSVNNLLTAPLIRGGEDRRVTTGFSDESDGGALEHEIKGGMAHIPAVAFRSKRVIAKIQVEYDGPTTSGHITTACWEWHPVKYAFTEFGGTEHNQRT